MGIIKTVKSGTPKDALTNLLETKTVPQGAHVVYQTKSDESRNYYMVAWKVQSKYVKVTTSSLIFYLLNAPPLYLEILTQKRYIICVKGWLHQNVFFSRYMIYTKITILLKIGLTVFDREYST